MVTVMWMSLGDLMHFENDIGRQPHLDHLRQSRLSRAVRPRTTAVEMRGGRPLEGRGVQAHQILHDARSRQGRRLPVNKPMRIRRRPVHVLWWMCQWWMTRRVRSRFHALRLQQHPTLAPWENVNNNPWGEAFKGPSLQMYRAGQE